MMSVLECRVAVISLVVVAAAACDTPVLAPPPPEPPKLSPAAMPLSPIDHALSNVSAVSETVPQRSPCDLVDGGTSVLPDIVSLLLATQYRSWEIKRHCKHEAAQYASSGIATPSVAIGDYDNDLRNDYAVLLQSRNQAAPGRTIIVVFFNEAGGPVLVLAGDGMDYIATILKGARGYSYDTNVFFRYASDAVVTGCCECCGHSLLFRRGRFIRITTSD